MKSTRPFFSRLLIAFALLCLCTPASNAQTIIDEWSSVKTPPSPELKPVKVDAAKTAFLIRDLSRQTCNDPRCIAALPKIGEFLRTARAHGLPVIYSLSSAGVAKDIADAVAPAGDEPIVKSHGDKFIGTNLEQLLKDRGVQTVIIVGAAANGAVLYTASHAAFLGLKVIVPVDGSTAPDPFDELAVTRTLAVAPFVSGAVTLTRLGLISW